MNLIRLKDAIPMKPEDHLVRLRDAVRRFFPDGSMTVRQLKDEWRKGHVNLVEIGGKDYVTGREITKLKRWLPAIQKARMGSIYFIYCAGHIKIGFTKKELGLTPARQKIPSKPFQRGS